MYLAGVRLKAERDAARIADEQRWRERVIVSDTRTHFHRLNPQTELSERGMRSANQVSRLTGMLKSAPRKHTLLNIFLAGVCFDVKKQTAVIKLSGAQFMRCFQHW